MGYHLTKSSLDVIRVIDSQQSLDRSSLGKVAFTLGTASR